MSALLRILAWTLALALVALPVVAVVNGWIGADRWPLRTLRLHGGLARVDAQQVRATVLPFAHSGFFAVRLDQAQAAVARLPWVERAEVHKHWPDVLEVRIVEYRPFAFWGKDRLLSDDGRIFPRGKLVPPRGLPRLAGPDERVADVVALYSQSRDLFGTQPLQVAELALDDRGSWSLRLSDGSEVIVGKSEARLRLARFAHLLPQLRMQRGARGQAPLARADLRYTNGFALVWKEPGLGTRDSGLEKANSVSRLALAADQVPSPESRVPNPTNHEPRITNPGPST